LLGAFQRQVNAAFVDPDYITRVRRKLDLDQRQAAELFGAGKGSGLALQHFRERFVILG